MTTTSNLIAGLYQFDLPAGLRHVCQFVAVAAARAEKVEAEVVDCRFALGKLQVDRAAFASPHGHLLIVEGHPSMNQIDIFAAGVKRLEIAGVIRKAGRPMLLAEDAQ